MPVAVERAPPEVAWLIAMRIGDVAGDALTLDVVPGAGADATARIDTRLVASPFLGEICVPSMRPAWPPNAWAWLWPPFIPFRRGSTHTFIAYRQQCAALGRWPALAGFFTALPAGIRRNDWGV